MAYGRRTKPSWPASLFVTILSCIAAYGIAWLVMSLGKMNPGEYKAIHPTRVENVQVVSDGFVYYDGSSLTMVKSDGNTRWTYLIGTGYRFRAGDAGTAAWNGNTVTLLENGKGSVTYSGTMEGEVISALAGVKYSAIAVETADNEGDSMIVLIDGNGRKMTPYIESEQAIVVDYGFFSGDSLFWTLTLDANGTTPTTTVSTYLPGKRHMGSISNTDQVLYKALFQASQVMCVGETYIKRYDYQGTEDTKARELVYGWYLEDADTRSENPLMAFAANSQYDGEHRVQDVRLIRGNTSRIVHYPFGCKAICVRDTCAYGFSSEGYVMKAQLDTDRVTAHRLPVGVEEVYGVTADKMAVLGYGSGIYLVKLP